LALLIRRLRRRSANQRWRADTNDRPEKDTALCVSDSSNEGAGQALRDGHAWEQEQRDTGE
jgi:hypothetical protein